ncbi:MAG: proline dehydrogenase family protein [Actinomycetota bacterium]|nr:proline dehydrogenase family protein [Actinomycetota bacterium]
MKKLITGTPPGKALARRFVAGDTLGEVIAAARVINNEGMTVSLDHLGEEVHDVDSARKATEEYLESLDHIADDGLDGNVSIKLTQLGLAIDEATAAGALERLAVRAAELNTTVTVDMEDSRYTEATVRLYEEAQSKHGNLGLALQSYMRRTPDDLERVMVLGGHIRLCKGAYVESSEVALTSKAEVDVAFAEQLRTLMAAEQTKPAVATHDQTLIDLTRELAGERSTPFEFQMLYGVRTELQKKLVAEGYPVRVYLPYGSQWYPYLTRRLAERPANAWFFARSLFKG